MRSKTINALLLCGLVALGATAHNASAAMHGGMSGMGHGGAATMTPEKQQAVAAIREEIQAKAAPLRQDIFTKRAELDAVMAQAAPDLNKAKALNKEINALETQVGDLQLEAQARIAKETGVRGGMGMGGCSMMGGGMGSGGCPMMGGGAGMGSMGCPMMGGSGQGSSHSQHMPGAPGSKPAP